MGLVRRSLGRASGRPALGAPGPTRRARAQRSIEAWRRVRATCVPRSTARGAGASSSAARIEVALPGGEVVAGDVEVVDGSRTVRWTASAHDRALRVDTTLDVLLLTASQPDVRWRSLRVFRKGNRGTCVTWTVPGEGPEERLARALGALSSLVALRRRGLAEPLPLLFRGAMAMLGRFSDGPAPPPSELLAAGLREWSPYQGRGDAGDPAVRYCFDASYEELAELPIRDGDPVVRFDAGASRLLVYSLALLDGLCALDDVGTAT